MSESSPSPPPEHLGWDLHLANAAWRRCFVLEMVKAGHGWFGEARATLIPHVGREGVPQSALPALAGMSKQAVQQHLDDLVRDGIVERIEDATDARRKLIRLTREGHRVIADADRAKCRIEDAAMVAMGGRRLAILKNDLKALGALLMSGSQDS
ncbi:MAG: MarR family winged helix-turn-helix transcriptional regulator [Beijerinckiaceae bacterium]